MAKGLPLVVSCALVCAVLVVLAGQIAHTSTNRVLATPPSTLVAYVYSGNDPEYGRNLEFFIRHGTQDPHALFYIVLQQGGWHSNECSCKLGCPGHQPCLCQCPDELYAFRHMPQNTVLVWHENLCFDIGTVGDLIRKNVLFISSFQYFVILNSSVRGPFLPAYVSQLDWISIFTSRINAVAKLVGPAISCSGFPHVQSYFLTTDTVGLQIMIGAGALDCYDDQATVVARSEIGSSRAIINSGYSIDCLLLKYHGIDWRNASYHECNGRYNPMPAHMYDGVSIDPLETLFVKVKSTFLRDHWPHTQKSLKYSEWLMHKNHINHNDFDEQKVQYIRAMELRSRCFNTTAYRSHNYDLRTLSDAQVLEHFLNFGQFEARKGVAFEC